MIQQMNWVRRSAMQTVVLSDLACWIMVRCILNLLRHREARIEKNEYLFSDQARI